MADARTREPYDVVVLGAGPGGYVAAIRAAQLGLRAAVVEREYMGGVCLNVGCIPSKALIHNAHILSLIRNAKKFGITVGDVQADYGAAVDRSRKVVQRLVQGVEFLLKKNKVDVYRGEGKLAGRLSVVVNPEGRELKTRNVIVATGARPGGVPGVEPDGRSIVTYKEAIVSRELPPSVVIIGGSAIGVEFAYVYRSYGADVTIIELLPRLVPKEDEEVSTALERAYRHQGIKVEAGARVESVEKTKGKVQVTYSKGDQKQTVEANLLLLAAGVVPNSQNLGLEQVGVAIGTQGPERGAVLIDGRMATNVPDIYAIGDVTRKMPMLAHQAFAQGEIAAAAIAGQETHLLVYENIARATYCSPQVASLGLTETEARERGLEVKVGKVPLSVNGRALGMDDYEGFVKVVADARYGEVVGAHLIGPDVTELLPEFSAVQNLEGTTLEIGRTVHAHPTLSEVIREAALASLGQAIHL